MSIVRVLVALIIVGGAVAGGLWYAGILKVSSSGVSVDQNKAEDSTVSLATKAQLAFQSLQYQKALELYQKAVKETPKEVDLATATYCMAKALKEVGRKDEARDMYKKFVAEFPRDNRAPQAQKELDTLTLMAN